MDKACLDQLIPTDQRNTAMNKPKIAGFIATGIAAAIIAFFVVLFLIKILWAWTVPDLFPGAVAEGLVAGTISWYTAAKVAILLAVLSGISSSHSSN